MHINITEDEIDGETHEINDLENHDSVLTLN